MTERLAQLASELTPPAYLSEADSVALVAEAGIPIDEGKRSDSLRVASISIATSLLLERSLDLRLKDEGRDSAALSPAADGFKIWMTFVRTLDACEELPTDDDLLLFASVGALAGKTNRVRSFLNRPRIRRSLAATPTESQPDWIRHVRSSITTSLLLLLRQNNFQDVDQSAVTLKHLAETQKTVEKSWLESQGRPEQSAMRLLGLYHLAQAVLRVAEFVRNGSVQSEGRKNTNVFPEMRRLLVRAEEFIELTRDAELRLWSTAVGVCVAYLHSSSIWNQARGISDNVDRLLESLTDEAQATQIYSLLPSQQEALQQSLFDPQRVAVVLQMPTSAGKTLLAELTIVQTIGAFANAKPRIVYLVPTRALATQVRRTLTQDLTPIGIAVSAAGSSFEEDPFEVNLLEASDGVIISTPEKLDLLLRAHPEWFAQIRLVIVDEAHQLKDGERGVRLELLLSNLRREFPAARMLLLTPFITNASEVAHWLGQTRATTIQVQWRPSNVLIGIANVETVEKRRRFRLSLRDPIDTKSTPVDMTLPKTYVAKSISSNRNKVVALASQLQKRGSVLSIFSASKKDAELAAKEVADDRGEIPDANRTAGLRVAIALAKHEYGATSALAHALSRGVAFHHSSLSPTLRYLVEEQVATGLVSFVAATATLAQGMNFPVATVLIHSVHKPYGKGDFTPSEFWNIAGRAGRVGLADQGIVVFVDKKHKAKCDNYATTLSESVRSALLAVIQQMNSGQPMKEQYRTTTELRPFFQYLSHAAAKHSPAKALADLEELIQQSLVNQQVRTDIDSKSLRNFSRRYLNELSGAKSGYLKIVDSTGLGSFSFNELYAKIRDSQLLRSGPSSVLREGDNGMVQLVDALRWLPEMKLGLTGEEGGLDAAIVARVVQEWIAGKPVHELAANFKGSEDEKIRKAGEYVYSTVSQNLSWGAHAYLRSLSLVNSDSQLTDNERSLPSLIQYGVRSAEAAVASLLGVPRAFAEAAGAVYRQAHGELKPESSIEFKRYIEQSSEATWKSILETSNVGGVAPGDVRTVFRRMQGFRD